MSSALNEWSLAEDVHRTTGRRAAAEPGAHPRGAGLRVLSRIARSRADEDSDYRPRHRLDVPVDSEPQVVAG
jgi:hypothetical protein